MEKIFLEYLYKDKCQEPECIKNYKNNKVCIF